MAAISQYPASTLIADNDSATLRGEEEHMGTTFEMMNWKGDTRGIVISIQESPPAAGRITPPDKEREEPEAALPLPPPPPPPAQFAPPPKILAAGNSRPSSPLRISTTAEPPSRAPSPGPMPPVQRESPRSPTLVRNGSIASIGTGTHSPVMRSMFPRFEPGVPLTKQNYVPGVEAARPVGWQGEASSHQNYSPSLYSQPGSPPQSVRSNWKATRVTPAGTGKSPLHNSELPPPNLSGPEALLDLWSMASGQDSEEAVETHTLGLRCDDLTARHETISFNSSTAQMYTLSASNAAITITRTHPITPTPTVTVTTTTIATPSASSPLITSIFPKMAELMALDHASSIAVAHNLNRKDSADLQAEAILRTRDAEASNLLWDSDSSRYYLIHPTLASGEPATLPFEIDPLTSSITLLSSTSSASAQPFVAVSLATNVLTINTPAVALLESMYALDTMLAAMLTLLLHLHRTATMLTPQIGCLPDNTTAMNLNFAPPPTMPLPVHSRGTKSLRSQSRARSKSRPPQSRPASTMTVATFQEQYEASQQQQTLAELQSLGLEDPEKGIAPELRASNGVDLSKFQSYDLNDRSLPAPTRAVLRMLYWFFGVLVWVLGVVVGIVAAGVVALGGCVKRL